jgi:hypothetical protein
MAQLKRFLAGTMALCVAGSLMTACGGNDDSGSTSGGSTASKSGDSAAANSVADVSAADTEKLTEENVGKKYNIYCWNTEFQSRFETYYWPNRDEALWDGVEVNWVINPNDDNNYQTKLDEALGKQNAEGGDDNVDMFLVEADYCQKYVTSDACLDVIKEIGLTKDDMKDQYAYTQEAMTDSNGTLKGVSWQATPGLFLYNTEYAKQVLGTDDPAEVQAAVADWDKFAETAQKMKDAGIFMVSGFDDTYRCFSNNVAGPWVQDGKVVVDPQIKAWVDQTKEYTDAGYNNKTSLWDDAWTAGQKIDGKVFGYFFSTWGIPFTLLPNTLDKSADEGGEMAEGNGGYGKWKACEGPQAYFWGGTWLCGAFGSDNIAITRDIMLKLTCDADIMAQITETEQDYTNNKAAIQKLIDAGYSNPFLGGQDHLSLLSAAAENINMNGKLSPYDQGCNEEFQGAMKDYFTGNAASYEDALATFKTNITTKYGDLSMD